MQPTHKDPKMFSLRCKLGKEKEAVLSLINKFIFFKGKPGHQLLISSASHIEKFPGYIYVEAENEACVRKACTDLKSVSFGNGNRNHI